MATDTDMLEESFSGGFADDSEDDFGGDDDFDLGDAELEIKVDADHGNAGDHHATTIDPSSSVPAPLTAPKDEDGEAVPAPADGSGDAAVGGGDTAEGDPGQVGDADSASVSDECYARVHSPAWSSFGTRSFFLRLCTARVLHCSLPLSLSLCARSSAPGSNDC
jgi:hypothetical protein